MKFRIFTWHGSGGWRYYRDFDCEYRDGTWILSRLPQQRQLLVVSGGLYYPSALIGYLLLARCSSNKKIGVLAGKVLGQTLRRYQVESCRSDSRGQLSLTDRPGYVTLLFDESCHPRPGCA